jgi:hypothetical protein
MNVGPAASNVKKRYHVKTSPIRFPPSSLQGASLPKHILLGAGSMKVLVFTMPLGFMCFGSTTVSIPSLVYVIQPLQLVGGKFLCIT